MKKAKMLMLAVLSIGMLTGCSKFSPDETAVSIGKNGEITAAVLDELDESYYNTEELKTNVESAVSDYNGSGGADSITIDKFDIKEDGSVKLFMKYGAYEDYAAFNNVTFYAGDITDGYNNGGYRFETTFQQVENGKVIRSDVDKNEIFEGNNHPMIVFQEEMAVVVPGKILYASSNVQVTGKKTAKIPGEEDETQSQSETSSKAESAGEDETGVPEIAPVKMKSTGEQGDTALAYIIYE